MLFGFVTGQSVKSGGYDRTCSIRTLGVLRLDGVKSYAKEFWD